MSIFDANLLAATITLTTPLLYAALGELVSERAGVINIGLEGMMLGGAFFSFWCASATGSSTLGILAGLGSGVAIAAIMALLSITLAPTKSSSASASPSWPPALLPTPSNSTSASRPKSC